MPSGIVTLLTDFGTADAYVGVVKGVILGINPAARVIDLTHAVPPQCVAVGALLLRAAVGFFPPGTVHVAVIDPGVGSTRRPILIETDGGVLVGPDNGVLTAAADALGRRAVRCLEKTGWFRRPVSQTFHGRDVFAPVAAHLSRGVPPSQFGSAGGGVVECRLPVPRWSDAAAALTGEVVHVDHFGNLLTNIDAAALERFRGSRVSVSIAGRRVVGPVSAYSAVAEGDALAIMGSWGMLEVAIRNGSAATMFAARAGTPVTVAAAET
jgi:S-adenosyl-L-methionine hydrolase (adenosine-forming)